MTATTNLGLPYIDGSQAQKHVTHNEALRILDAAIQIAVLDIALTAPPVSPSEGDRHIVAATATGAWTGHELAVATFSDGAWQFMPPKAGWVVWSISDNCLWVFDGAVWRDARNVPLIIDNATRIGINTTASSPNLLSVKSNGALLTAITTAGGGTGDARLQISKEIAAKTASVFFSDNFSGRAEFGLVGSDVFKLKVSPDGASWAEAFNVDQTTGIVSLPRGAALNGALSPPQITANQNDYAPSGYAATTTLRLNTDASRTITGLAGGVDGLVRLIVNVGGFAIVLSDADAASAAANRFAFGANLTLAAGQVALIWYDAGTSKWKLVACSSAVIADGSILAVKLDGATVAKQKDLRAAIYAAPFDAMAANGMQVNGNVDVSQELGTAGATLVNGTPKYTADNIAAAYNHAAGTAVVTSAQLAAASFPSPLPGYSFGHQIKATSAISSPANGDYAVHRFYVEGYRVARLGWGATGAQPLAYAIRFYSTVSGVVPIRFYNAANTRAFYQEQTVAAGWNWLTGTIPGDTSGVWLKDSSIGLVMDIYVAGKSASPASPGGWGSSTALQTTSSTNVLGSNGNQTIATGLILLAGNELPSLDRAALIMRPYDQELTLCRRYFWRRAAGVGNEFITTMQCYSSTGAYGKMFDHPVEMRAAPSIAYSAAGDFSLSNPNSTRIQVTSIGAWQTDIYGFSQSAGIVASGAALNQGGVTQLQFYAAGAWLQASARF